MMLQKTGGNLGAVPQAAGAVPFNIECEQALLGAIFMNNEALDRIGELVEPRHFFDPLHGRIFEAIQKCAEEGKTATPVTLQPFFAHEPTLGGISVPLYLARLMANCTSVLNAKDYAKTIRDCHDRRQLIVIGEDMAALAREASQDYPPAKQIEEAETRLFEISRDGAVTATREHTALEMHASMLDMVAAAYQRDDGLIGLSTGFPDLDKGLGGLAPGALIIIAGRPAMGKSALASNIGFNVARAMARQTAETGTTQGEVLFVSLEMSSEELAMREVAPLAEVSASRMREGRISEDEFRRIAEATRQNSALPIHVDFTGSISIAALMVKARRRKRLYGTKLIVVDYLQLMVSGERSGNRVEEITKITVGLKAMAKELGVPVIALSQLSREVEKREDKRPQLADLRESGSIEQDADVVLFVYREEYYVARREPPEEKVQQYTDWEADMERCRGIAEIVRAKHRHGSTGTTKMHFEGQFTRFSDLDTRYGDAK